MAGQSKRGRRESKRVRLGKALRAELSPLMKSHGFRNAPELWDRAMSPTPADHWMRKRGAYTDQLYLQWEKYGRAKFRMCLASDQRGHRLGSVNCIYALAGYRFALDASWFGGWLRTEKATAKRAAERALEGIRYLETGERSRYVGGG